MKLISSPLGTWNRKNGKPGKLHIFTDESKQETLCGFTRGDRPLAYEDSGYCKVCDRLADRPPT